MEGLMPRETSVIRVEVLAVVSATVKFQWRRHVSQQAKQMGRTVAAIFSWFIPRRIPEEEEVVVAGGEDPAKAKQRRRTRRTSLTGWKRSGLRRVNARAS